MACAWNNHLGFTNFTRCPASRARSAARESRRLRYICNVVGCTPPSTRRAVGAKSSNVSTDDTKGQTCYICTQALHWKTKEGLVRMCACRGTAGFAHVSCLAEQAKILYAEAEENNPRSAPAKPGTA